MTATYPDDAKFDTNNFTTVGTVTYSSTGSDTAFNLATAAAFPGEVLAVVDGVTQAQTAYFLNNSGATINFFIAPNATNLYLKTISIPSRFRKQTALNSIVEVNYSNSSATVVNSNSYIVDGETTTWAVPEGTSPDNKGQLLVFISGAAQSGDYYTYPSSVLGNQGIEIIPALETSETSDTELSVRVLTVSGSQTIRFTDMGDRRPDIGGINFTRNIPVSKYTSQSGFERRRLLSRKSKRNWQLSYSRVSGVEKQAIDDFYISRNGEFEAFFFDLDHINESGTVTVTFEGGVQYNLINSRGDNAVDRFYDVTLSLKEVDG